MKITVSKTAIIDGEEVTIEAMEEFDSLMEILTLERLAASIRGMIESLPKGEKMDMHRFRRP